MTFASTREMTSTVTAAPRSWWVRLDTAATDRLSGRPADERRGPSVPRRAGVAEIRTPAEIELMAEAGRVAALALRAASAACVPGATTAAVDGAAAGVIAAERCEPAFLGLRNAPEAPAFPAATCVSVNEQVVHGVPGERRLVDGDVVKIDCGVRCRGWCADAAVTVVVGQSDDARLAMVARARAMLDEAIAARGEELAAGTERAATFLATSSRAVGQIRAVWACGGGSRIPGMLPWLGERLRVPVQPANALAGLSVAPDALEFLPSDELAPLLMLPVGLALRAA